MKVHFGTGRKSHREEEKGSPSSKTPQRKMSRNPEKWLRQQPRASASAENVCIGRGGAEKKVSGGGGRERGLEQENKKPVKVAQLLKEPNLRNCPQ